MYYFAVKSGDVISRLMADGWFEVATTGSHVQFKHPQKPGRVTVPPPQAGHPLGHLEEHRKAIRIETEVAVMRNYIALIHKEKDSDYGVSFPDFPGVVTAGTDLDDARLMAVEALSLHVDGLLEDGGILPDPSTLEAVMSDPENRDAVATLIPLKTESKKVARLNITLPEDVLREVDAYANAHGLTRSGFLAQSARKAMETA